MRRRFFLLILTVGLVATGTVPSRTLVPAFAAGPGIPPNYLANPSFETAGPASWTVTGTGARITTDAHDGGASVTMSGASTKWTSALFSPGVPGAYRVMSAWFKRPPGPKNANNGAHMELTYYADALGLLATGTVLKTDSTGTTCLDVYYTWAGEWCYQLIAGAVPAGATRARVVLITQSNNVGQWLADEISYGPFTNSPSAVGSQIPPTAPSGTATVNVGSSVLRPVSPLLFGDGLLYRHAALPNYYDNTIVHDAIRTSSKPVELRFPGGDNAQLYDWEHPDSRSGCVFVPNQGPASEGCGAPTATATIDEFMQYVRATQATEVLWTLNVSGKAGAFTVRYTGNAPTAQMTVTSNALSVALGAGATDGTASTTVPFTSTTTIGDVVNTLNATPGYTATMLADETARTSDPVLNELMAQAPIDVKSGAKHVRVDESNPYKALRLIDYANNPNSTQIGPSGLTRDAWLTSHGFAPGPYNITRFELGNEQSYINYAGGGVDPLTMALKLKSIAQTIKAAQPTIKLGIGGPVSMVNFNAGIECCGTHGAQYVFGQVMYREVGPHVDFVIDHPYQNSNSPDHFARVAFPEHLRRIDFVNWIQEQFERHSADHRPDIDVFLTEYNTGTTNSVTDMSNVIFVLDMIGQAGNQGAAEANHHAQLDFPFASHEIGGSGPGTTVAKQSGGFALEMFAKHWGTDLLTLSATSPHFAVTGAGAPHANHWPIKDGGATGKPLQPAYASRSADGTKIYLLLINKGNTTGLLQNENNKPLNTSITLSGFTPQANATYYQIRPNPSGLLGGGAPQLVTGTITNAATTFNFTNPTHTATLIEFTRQ